MVRDTDALLALRSAWSTRLSSVENDYALVCRVGSAYAAHTRSGLSALLVPVRGVDRQATGRRAFGCELIGYEALAFSYAGREWEGPAAVLLCTDAHLAEPFAVLAADVVSRAGSEATWNVVLSIVEEWQNLLAPHGKPTAESEVGLWGELWFIAASSDVDRAVAGWRGPDGDAVDFFLGGVAAEVKTSRTRRQHHVSLSQVDPARPTADSWLVSLYVKTDPEGAVSVPTLAESIVARATNPAEAMRRIAKAGFGPADRKEFGTAFALAAEPEWYAFEDVPRVRSADAGVMALRYRVALDETKSATPGEVARLTKHFHGVSRMDVTR